MELQVIQQKIYEVRGEKVMLDFDLAELLEVETKVLNQAVKRNADLFRNDFMFRLTPAEWASLRSQIVTSKRGGTRYQPYAFTEHGVVAVPFILKSKRATDISRAIVRAFVALRTLVKNTEGLSDYVRLLEQKYDQQFADINDVLNFLMNEKKNEQDWTDRARIGFNKDDEK